MSESDTERVQSQESQDEVEVPNQYAVGSPVRLETTTEKTIRVSVEDLITLGSETRMLREQVNYLQALGTAQLLASRAATFEMCAMICEQVALEIDSEDLTEGCTEAQGALRCAKAIRELATRGPAT